MNGRTLSLALGFSASFVLLLACSSGSGDGGSGGGSQGGSNDAKGGSASGSGGGGGASSSGGAAAGGKVTQGDGGAATGGAKSSAGGGAGGKASGAGGKASVAGGGRACETVQCLRAIECVEKCGGPVISSGCCPCENGTIDRVTECGGSGGSGSGAGGARSGGATGAGGARSGGAGGASNAGAGGLDLSKLNTSCVDGKCPTGLTPIKFYGVAGPSGPEFCWCSISCKSGASACPTGTQCQTVADGPGEICMKN